MVIGNLAVVTCPFYIGRCRFYIESVMRAFCPNCQSHQEVYVLMYSADQSWLVCRRCQHLRIAGSFQRFLPDGGRGSPQDKEETGGTS